MLGFLVLFLRSELAIVLQWTSINLPIWVVFGMTGQVAVLAYPWLSSHFGAALSGRATTAMNLVLFLFAFGAQYAIGAIIDLFPTRRRRLRPARLSGRLRRVPRGAGPGAGLVPARPPRAAGRTATVVNQLPRHGRAAPRRCWREPPSPERQVLRMPVLDGW